MDTQHRTAGRSAGLAPQAAPRLSSPALALLASLALWASATAVFAQASGPGEGLQGAKEAIVEAAKKTGQVAKQAASATAKVAVSVGKGSASAATGAWKHTKQVSKQAAGEVAGKAKQGAGAVKDAASK